LSNLKTADRLSGAVIIADTTQHKTSRELAGFDAFVRDVAWSPDGRRLALCTDDGRIECWDTVSDHRLWLSRLDRFPVWSLAFGAGQIVAVSGTNEEPGCGGAVTFFDAETGQTLATDVLRDTPTCLAIDLEGNRAYSGCRYGGLVTVFDIAKHSRINQFGWRKGISGGPKDYGVIDLALSEDGRVLVIAGDVGLSVWDVQARRQTHEQAMPSVQFFGVQILPGANSFVASYRVKARNGTGEPRDVHIGKWTLEENNLRTEADKSVDSVSFALLPDGRGVYLAMKNGIRRVSLP
jgi:WD40 repeat protein